MGAMLMKMPKSLKKIINQVIYFVFFIKIFKGFDSNFFVNTAKFEVLVESPSNSEDSCKKVAIFKNMKELNIKAEAEDIESLNKKIEECEMDEVLIRRSQGMNVSENDQAMHGDLKACMASMGLPSFKSFYLFLSKVLLDIMHEGL